MTKGLETHEDHRRKILDLSKEYFEARSKPLFVPGQTQIPCTGKLLDSGDLRYLLDASLDLWLTTGRYAALFEDQLTDYAGVQFSRLTVSGSAANLLAFSALTSWRLNTRRIEPESEVIATAAAFPTTVAPIVQNGCVPVFVDVDMGTYNINVDRLADAIGPKTRAIMVAHTLGNPFDAPAVSQLAREHDLYLLSLIHI